MSNSYGRMAVSALPMPVSYGYGSYGHRLARAVIDHYRPTPFQNTFAKPAQKAPPKDPNSNLAYVTAIANQDGKGKPDLRVYGKRRVYPYTAASTYTRLEQGDQNLYGLFNLGQGTIAVSDIRIGLRKINSTGATYEIKKWPTETITKYKWNDVQEILVGQQLDDNGDEWFSEDFMQPANEYWFSLQFKEGLIAYHWDGTNQVPQNRSVTFRIYTKEEGNVDWDLKKTQTIIGQQATHKEFAIKVDLGTNAQRQVRITRTTGAGSDNGDDGWHEKDKCTLINVLAYDEAEPPIRPRKDKDNNNKILNLMAFVGNADNERLSGQIEALNMMISGMVPIWNGTEWTEPQETSNPAWIYADMLCSTWFNKNISRDKLDIESLVEFATWCSLKGFEFNYAFDSQVELIEALKMCCAAGLAAPARTKGGKWGVAIDKPKTTPACVFLPNNTEKFTMQITHKTQPHGYVVRFANRFTRFAEDERTVYDDGYSQANGPNTSDFDFPGVTDPTHIFKLARYYIAVGQKRRRRFSFTTSLIGLRCQRGDLVYLTHPIPMAGIGATVIKSVTKNGSNQATGVVLRDKMPTADGVQYPILMQLSDGSVLEKTIVGDGTKKASFVFTTPVTSGTQPAVGNYIGFGGYIKCLVEDISWQGQLNARIVLVDYDESIYLADAGEIPDHVSNVTTVPDTQIEVPKPVVSIAPISDESVLLKELNGSYTTRVKIGLAVAPLYVSHIRWQARPVGTESWIVKGEQPKDTTVYITGVLDGSTYEFRLQYATRTGNVSEWQYLSPHFVVGKTTPPPDVKSFDLHGMGEDAVLRWRYDEATLGRPVPQDHVGFELRVHQGLNPTYATATVIEPLITGYSIPRSALPAGPSTVYIKAVDVAKNKSLGAAKVVLDTGDPIVLSSVAARSHEPNFSIGFKKKCEVDSGVLKAILTDAKFWAGRALRFWKGQQQPGEKFWQIPYEACSYTWRFKCTTTSIAPMALRVVANITGSTYKLWYRRLASPSTAKYWKGGGAAGAKVWGRGNPFGLYWASKDENGNEKQWMLMPQSIQVSTNETIQFRIEIADGVTQGIINSLKEEVVVPTIEDVVETIIVPPEGVRLTLNRAFSSILSVTPSFEYHATYNTGVKTVIVDRQVGTPGVANGPLVQAFDATNTPVYAQLHVRIRGAAA